MSVDSYFNESMRSSAGDGIIAFVILHYKSYELTCNCIESLLKLSMSCKNNAIRIVIVDNASRNGSLEHLLDRYGNNNSDIRFIANPDNLGFSRANNIGFRYARDTWNPSFIVVANNDIQVEQADFAAALDSVYFGHHPFLIGPDIYCARLGFHQSPMNSFPTLARAQDLLERYKNPFLNRSARDYVKRLGYSIPGFRNLLAKRSLRKSLEEQRSFDGWKIERSEGITLQGACLIFTRDFIETGEDPFFPETFLYEEESILAWRFKKNGWPILYTPRLQIIHYNDGATDLALANREEKEAFLRKNEILSLGILIEYMNN
jgi:GT2 family glycosyltransferase